MFMLLSLAIGWLTEINKSILRESIIKWNLQLCILL